ncbi:hypothetical protein ACO2TQ_35140 [Burkholderia sp. OKR4-1]|uniref:Uncharacterized protein n=1 Tax=Burkholderia stabilis TaxID=95485 RepID=A0AAJ5NKR7_9BURK|nr:MULTISPECIES: hypothetical protein [Burkholderia cepacia complex]MDK0999561.1 hypothetical protein [Burkholderia contaminans]VBB17275.1 hypothetical protein BSTAB16_7490 [Burkholderia stabilis]
MEARTESHIMRGIARYREGTTPSEPPMYCVLTRPTGAATVFRDADHLVSNLKQFRGLSIRIEGTRPGSRSISVDIPDEGDWANLTYGSRHVIHDLRSFLEEHEEQRLARVKWAMTRDVPTLRQLIQAFAIGIAVVLKGSPSRNEAWYRARYVRNALQLLQEGLLPFGAFRNTVETRPIAVVLRGEARIVDPDTEF